MRSVEIVTNITSGFAFVYTLPQAAGHVQTHSLPLGSHPDRQLNLHSGEFSGIVPEASSLVEPCSLRKWDTAVAREQWKLHFDSKIGEVKRCC